MKPIRAWHGSFSDYCEIFQEITGMSDDDFDTYLPTEGSGIGMDWTNGLTGLRENLTNAGYAKEVEEADKRHIEGGRGLGTPEDWEEFWTKLFTNDPEYQRYRTLRPDLCAPEDAL